MPSNPPSDKPKPPSLEETFEKQLQEAGETTYERECKEPYRRATAANPRSRPRADFCWSREKVVVEVEGGTWSGGRHTTGAGFARDARKHAFALLDGWAILRVTSETIKKSTDALNWTLELLEMRRNAAM